MPEQSRLPTAITGQEVRQVLEATQAASSYLMLRDGSGQLIVHPLTGVRFLIGRDQDCDLSLAWDKEVSRVHAELERLGSEWTIRDDGLSNNGTFIGADRVVGRRRLRTGEVIRLGSVLLAYRMSEQSDSGEQTHVDSDGRVPPDITKGQKDALDALVRPMLVEGTDFPGPATNREIADELHLSVDTVKGHLRELFRRFNLQGLPQNRKRAALIDQAIAQGLLEVPRRNR